MTERRRSLRRVSENLTDIRHVNESLHLEETGEDAQERMKSIFSELTSKSSKVKFNLKHVETVVKHQIDIDSYRGNAKPYPFDFYYDTPRFDVDDPAAYKYLEENGYVVIKNVLSTTSEVEEVKNMMWQWLESIEFNQWPTWWTKERIEREKKADPKRYRTKKKIDRNDVETWKWLPIDPKSGITFGFGVGQASFQWKIRSNPNVQKAFANIWGTDDLITSFDGCNFYRPWKYNESWATNGKWWHVDQNARNPESVGLQSVQGLVPLMDCDETVGGLCVIPKTHLIHNQLSHRIKGYGTGDFISVPVTDSLWDEYPQGGVLVRCKAGDLCLWDSRTVHCNSPAINAPSTVMMSGKQKIERNFLLKNKKKSSASASGGTGNDKDANGKEKKWDLIRMTCYVCMTPRYKATNEVLKDRQNAFKKHITSTHWPHKYNHKPTSRNFVAHGKQLYAGKPFVELDENQKRLVGKPRTISEEIIWQSTYGLSKLVNFSDLWMAGNLVIGGFVVWNAIHKK